MEADENYVWSGNTVGQGKAYPRDKVIYALLSCGGIQSEAAKMLKISSGVLGRIIKADKDMQEIISDGLDNLLDMSQVVVRKGLEEVDEDKHHALDCAKTAVKWLGKLRGWGDSTTAQSSGNATVIIHTHTDATDAPPDDDSQTTDSQDVTHG